LAACLAKGRLLAEKGEEKMKGKRVENDHSQK
jgi:hypothetical protein